MSDVWVKVKLSGDLHDKFRTWAFNNRCSMQGAVVAWVEQACGLRAGGTDGDAQRGGSIPRSKTVKVTLDVTSESKSPAPSPQPDKHERMPTEPYVEPPEMKKCAKCFDVFSVACLIPDPKTRKLYCPSCVEDMKNGQ